MQLELLKQSEDCAAGKAQIAAAEFSWQVTSLFMGLMFPAGYIASFGKAAENTKKAIDVVKTAIDAAEKAEMSNYWSTTTRDIMEYLNFAMCRANSNNQLDSLLERMKFDYKHYDAQFAFRSKIIYGLVTLVAKCGPYEGASSKFAENVKKYQIEEYIDRFCLKPFWVRKAYIQEDWVDCYHLESSSKREDIIKFDDPKNEAEWIVINFHDWFPIHYCEHKDILEFTKFFSTDYGGITEDLIEDAYWECMKTGYSPKVGTEEYIKVLSWEKIKHMQEIKSENPVRGVVIFREGTRANIPVQFQLFNTRGKNIAGPVYNALTRPVIDNDKLPKEMKGKMCAIAEFVYSWGWKEKGEKIKPIQGIRPFATKGGWNIEVAQKNEMALYVAIGREEVKGYIHKGNFKDDGLAKAYWKNSQNVIVNPYLVRGEKQRRECAKFTDLEFLREYD